MMELRLTNDAYFIVNYSEKAYIIGVEMEAEEISDSRVVGSTGGGMRRL